MFKLILGLKHHGRGLYLEMVDFDYHQDPTPQQKVYHLEPQNLKHVETAKVQIITRFDTSLEGS